MGIERFIDLRSDTVTVPTPQMREAMATAAVGDDVYGEDPTVNELEARSAELMGKEAGLFLPSGTMANQVAILAHTDRGDEVIVDSESHIFYYELAAPAVAGGVQLHPVPALHSPTALDRLTAAIRPQSLLFPRTKLICLENTHNRLGGTVTPPTVMEAIYTTAHDHGLVVHLDGARIFNAAVYLGLPAREIACWSDSVMFCLSKGLAAPVGSVLTGSRSFIDRARKYRKLLGGGMRQAGILAAAGLVALETMIDRLSEDHANAKHLAEGLAKIPGIKLDLNTVQTNIVICDIEKTGLNPDEFISGLKANGVLANSFGGNLIRFIAHKDVKRADIEQALEVIRSVVARKAR